MSLPNFSLIGMLRWKFVNWVIFWLIIKCEIMNKVKSMWQIIQSDDYTATTPNLMTFRILFALLVWESTVYKWILWQGTARRKFGVFVLFAWIKLLNDRNGGALSFTWRHTTVDIGWLQLNLVLGNGLLMMPWHYYDVITFSHYWPLRKRIHRSPVDSPKKGSDADCWFSLWCPPE